MNLPQAKQDPRVATRRLLVLLCLVSAVVACGGETAAKPKPRFCSPESTRVACTSARVGVEYALSLSAHCGVRHTYFDGRFWIIDPAQPYAGNHIDGVMTLVTRNLAQFRGAGMRFAFKPAPSFFVPPACY